MRKSIVSSTATAKTSIEDHWRDLERIARIELSSEDAAFPIEDALGKAEKTGWRAGATGPQMIRLLFDEPQNIRRIKLHFVDAAAERSQEFAVYAGSGTELQEVVRQQWSFSPQGATEEIEDYKVELNGGNGARAAHRSGPEP